MIKIAKIMIITATFFSLFVVFVPKVSLADCASPATTKEAIQCGSCDASGQTTCNTQNPGKSLDATASHIINLLSVFVGIIAVIMIIVAGLRYITGGSDSNKISAAKNTLLWALIGLVIVALAQVIVKFVLHETTQPGSKSSNSSPSTQPDSAPGHGGV